MRKYNIFPLSIRSQITLMILGSILVVQSAVFFAGNFLKEKFIEDVVADYITTTIRIIRSSVTLLHPEDRDAFIKSASRGRWSLATQQLPQAPYLSFWSEDNTHSKPFLYDHPPPPSAIAQLLPYLNTIDDELLTLYASLIQRKEKHHNVKFPRLHSLSSAVQEGLADLITQIEKNLNDGTRMGLVQSDNTPFLYLSLLPEYNPYDNTLVKEWLVIPLDNLEPINSHAYLLVWVSMTALLLIVTGYFAWKIISPLRRLTQSTDQLAKGVHTKVVPSGPYETMVLGKRFNAMLNSLEQTKTVQHTLLAGLPHDLKGPLTRMRLRLEICEDESLKEGMLNDVQDMQNIIGQFINYVRGSDPEKYRFKPVVINQWLSEYVSTWKNAGSDVSIPKNTKKDTTISADTLALNRLFDNLISNSLKHAKPPIEIFIKKINNEVLISICDRGEGIPKERREEALRAFSRLDPARTKTGSVGLGLALVEMIVNAHKGNLTLADSPSGGLRVDITFPLI